MQPKSKKAHSNGKLLRMIKKRLNSIYFICWRHKNS